jgi:hypothetical protein
MPRSTLHTLEQGLCLNGDGSNLFRSQAGVTDPDHAVLPSPHLTSCAASRLCGWARAAGPLDAGRPTCVLSCVASPVDAS